MDQKNSVRIPDRILKYCLVLCLSFSALMFLFVFILNWEDWFFGTKLDGAAAGLYLFAKWLISGVLAVALVRYPRYSRHLAAAAVCYYGWLLLDSSVTSTILTHHKGSFPLVPAVLFLIALAYLFINTITTRCQVSR